MKERYCVAIYTALMSKMMSLVSDQRWVANGLMKGERLSIFTEDPVSFAF